ncbi:MAG TPA: hypothetical protein VG871_05135 [Vicinamibacterales bacterium]|nr:hypothetical protein [Vicinamibacterales bacterium]
MQTRPAGAAEASSVFAALLARPFELAIIRPEARPERDFARLLSRPVSILANVRTSGGAR